MQTKDFFNKVKRQIEQQLPFVLYRKATSASEKKFQIKAYFQTNPELYFAKSYTESGFVMAAFDLESQASPLIPTDFSEYVQIEIEQDELKTESPSGIPYPDQSKEKDFHVNLVQKGIDTIRQSDLKKVVLSRKLSQVFNGDILQTFERLLKTYPTAFVYCWFHPKIGMWMGATPETLLKISGKEFKTMALASTKPVEENASPKWTQKEKDEQQFVTDFIVETLKDNVQNLRVEEVNNIRAGKLWHLKCDIIGQISSTENLQQIIENLHPTPAVCGMPKQLSKEFILREENYNREFYTGFIGELNLPTSDNSSKNTELFVNLRCMQIKDNICEIYVGGGIVKDSIPESEWEETVNKSRTMLDVIERVLRL